MVIAGRELAAFIPRSELNGSAPGFRVSNFRHEGDYGLQGGPWDAAYYPALDDPLMPAEVICENDYGAVKVSSAPARRRELPGS